MTRFSSGFLNGRSVFCQKFGSADSESNKTKSNKENARKHKERKTKAESAADKRSPAAEGQKDFHNFCCSPVFSNL